jgi:hypothetical protein
MAEERSEETQGGSASQEGSSSPGLGDFRSLLRQLVGPVIEKVEEQVSTQIDKEVADRFDDLIATRMATIDRAIGDLDRHIKELSARLDRIESSMGSDQADDSFD